MFLRAAAFRADTFAARFLGGTVGGGTPTVVAAAPALTYGGKPLSRERVEAKWQEIDAIERLIAANEEAARERVRQQEEAKRQLADLAEKKRQTKTIAERKRKLEARIAAYQSEIAELRATVDDLLAEIEETERARAEAETIADRRRRMLLLIAAAS
jgi:chromosome segregation ATPase